MTFDQYLLYSARVGDLDGIKECIDEDIPVDTLEAETSNTSLHMACANGFDEIVKFLIEKGADINAKNISGNTPLHWACLNGKSSIVDILLEQKVDDKHLVDVNAKNIFKRIPMEEALLAGRSDMAEILAPLSKLEEDKMYATADALEKVNEEEEEKIEEEDHPDLKKTPV